MQKSFRVDPAYNIYLQYPLFVAWGDEMGHPSDEPAKT